MIYHPCAKVAVELTAALAEENIGLMAVTGSPLDRLINSISVPGPATPVDDRKYQLSAPELVGISDNWGGQDRDEPSQFSTNLEQVAEFCGKAVADHFLYAQSVASPLVVELVGRVQKAMSEVNFDPYVGFGVKEFALPALLNDSDLLESIEQAQAHRLVVANLPRLSFAARERGELLDLLGNYGGNRQSLMEWVSGLDEGDLEQFWSGVFCSNYSNPTFENTKPGRTLTDLAVFTYLMCEVLANDPPSDAGQSLSNLTASLTTLRRHAAKVLIYAKDEYGSQVNNDILFIRRDDAGVHVNREVYAKHKEAGLDQALVVANAMQSKPYLYGEEILKNEADLRKTWERHVAGIRTRMMNNQVGLLASVARRESIRIAQDNFESIYECMGESAKTNRNNAFYMEFLTKLDARLRFLKEEDVANVVQLCHDIVCNAMLYWSAANEILSGINRAVAENPTIRPAEAANLSRTEYVMRYLCDMMVRVPT